MMPTLKDINARKEEASGQVSTLTRSLALGYIAISWTLLTAHEEPLRAMVMNVHRYLILGLTICSVLFLACDLLQYVAITNMAEKASHEALLVDPPQIDQYDKTYNLAQSLLYRAKFWIIALGAVLLIAIFILLFLPINAPPSSTPSATPVCATVPSHDSATGR
jgi:hypothetical protein